MSTRAAASCARAQVSSAEFDKRSSKSGMIRQASELGGAYVASRAAERNGDDGRELLGRAEAAQHNHHFCAQAASAFSSGIDAASGFARVTKPN